MRAVSRVCTVAKLLEDAGEASMEMHDGLMRNVKATRIAADEIWSFNYCKKKNYNRQGRTSGRRLSVDMDGAR